MKEGGHSSILLADRIQLSQSRASLWEWVQLKMEPLRELGSARWHVESYSVFYVAASGQGVTVSVTMTAQESESESVLPVLNSKLSSNRAVRLQTCEFAGDWLDEKRMALEPVFCAGESFGES
jgi:hypothetical protein